MKLRQASIEAAAVTLLAAGLVREANQKNVTQALMKYLNLRFPGRPAQDKDEARRMRQARDMLAREVEKVYLITPYAGDGKDLVTGAMESANPAFAAAARQAIAVEAREAIRKRDVARKV